MSSRMTGSAGIRLSKFARTGLGAVFAALVGAGCSTPAAIEPQAPAPPAPPTSAPQIARPVPERQPALPPVVPARGKGEQELEKGTQSYEEANYSAATRQFHAALESGLATPGDRANAHKYLAFVACASRQERLCRDEFRKAFEADPDFALAPSEAGHPIWGPVFRSVKGEFAAKARPK